MPNRAEVSLLGPPRNRNMMTMVISVCCVIQRFFLKMMMNTTEPVSSDFWIKRIDGVGYKQSCTGLRSNFVEFMFIISIKKNSWIRLRFALVKLIPADALQ